MRGPVYFISQTEITTPAAGYTTLCSHHTFSLHEHTIRWAIVTEIHSHVLQDVSRDDHHFMTMLGRVVLAAEQVGANSPLAFSAFLFLWHHRHRVRGVSWRARFLGPIKHRVHHAQTQSTTAPDGRVKSEVDPHLVASQRAVNHIRLTPHHHHCVQARSEGSNWLIAIRLAFIAGAMPPSRGCGGSGSSIGRA